MDYRKLRRFCRNFELHFGPSNHKFDYQYSCPSETAVGYDRASDRTLKRDLKNDFRLGIPSKGSKRLIQSSSITSS